MKSLIYISLTIGSIAGSWLGSLFDNGNLFGFWGIFLGFVGAIGGLYVGYIRARNTFNLLGRTIAGIMKGCVAK